MGKFAEISLVSDLKLSEGKAREKSREKDIRMGICEGTGLGICHLFSWIYNLGGVREEMI